MCVCVSHRKINLKQHLTSFFSVTEAPPMTTPYIPTLSK